MQHEHAETTEAFHLVAKRELSEVHLSELEGMSVLGCKWMVKMQRYTCMFASSETEKSCALSLGAPAYASKERWPKARGPISVRPRTVPALIPRIVGELTRKRMEAKKHFFF